ncbi:hypothetical protein [Yinghuangia soli]|uniref:DUF8094 domain-containing protein n=1 Tax=Yinghuangia soli TaxID=2908204 RepID=A0AA41U4M7_9ACTN|nr:hypothetical protein [Yinghuangia soli]MCF2533101.1 hypothetical protein [Yinghuangia soli]
MSARQFATAATALALAAAATGCMTVDGEKARVPGLSKSEAAQVLVDFDARNNQVWATRDAELNALNETGSFGAIDTAALRIKNFTDPRQTKPSVPFTHDKPQFWIPRPVGWPKWFAVQNTPSYTNARTMLLVFTKENPDAPWKAAWGPSLRPGESFPEPHRDAKGYVTAVPLDEAGLVAAPKDTAGVLTGYLADGKASADLLTPSAITQELRKPREEPVQDGFVRQFVDAPATQFPPLAIRTKDGGALVLLTATHSMKLTVQPPNTLGEVEAHQQAFLSRKPERSVTEHRLAEYAVVVPKAGQGRIKVVASASGVIGADGE